MPIILLSENNSLSKKVFRAPLPESNLSILEIPSKKLRKRGVLSFRKRLEAPGLLVFSKPELSYLVPAKDTDAKDFYNLQAADILFNIAKSKSLSKNRLVISDPSEKVVLYAINLFRDVALYGENALSVANYIYRQSGASVPIVSGSKSSDILLFLGESYNLPSCLSSGFNLKPGDNTIGCDSLKFYPKGEYSSLTTFLGRPLTTTEAALLSEYDNKSTFNIAF